jgi:acid phosphatase (class A)
MHRPPDTVARLQTDPAFLADLKAAEVEVSATKATPSASMPDCAAEAAALSQQ